MNDRRRFLTGLGGVLAWPRFALAQQAERIYRLGWLSTIAPRTEPYNVAFVQRLRELGFAEGRNLVIEFRAAEGRTDRLADLAADLARQNCDVLLAPGQEASLVAIKQASRDTPIVMVANDYDPVATGHIASLARPGGRITGVSPLQSELPGLIRRTYRDDARDGRPPQFPHRSASPGKSPRPSAGYSIPNRVALPAITSASTADPAQCAHGNRCRVRHRVSWLSDASYKALTLSRSSHSSGFLSRRQRTMRGNRRA